MTSKLGVGEGHLLGSSADQRATRVNAFELEVMQRRGFGVAAHVHVGPDVYAGGVAGSEMFGCAGE